MIGRCKSTDPEHVARRCRDCKMLYNRAYRESHKLPANRRPRLITNPAICALCGLTQGNSGGVPVFRYSLHRTLYVNRVKKTVQLAKLPLCDRCVMEHGTPAPVYMKAHGMTDAVWPKRERAA